jgi:hypothetical protein
MPGMNNRDYVRTQIETLPDSVIDKLQDYIAYQRFSLGLFENDTDYLTAIPGMVESIKAAGAEPLDKCMPVSEIWPDV